MHKFYGIIIATFIALGSYTAVAADRADAGNIEAEIVRNVDIKVTSHGVEIKNCSETAREVTVYAITGQLVKRLTVASGTTAIELNSGYYIVRIDGLSKRIIVR